MALAPASLMHLSLLVLSLGAPTSFAAAVPRDGPGPRPRLLATDDDFAKARNSIATEKLAGAYLETLEGWAEGVLNTSLSRTCKGMGKSGNSDTIRMLAQLWKHTGNAR
jgi:hypothetical protein